MAFRKLDLLKEIWPEPNEHLMMRSIDHFTARLLTSLILPSVFALYGHKEGMLLTPIHSRVSWNYRSDLVERLRERYEGSRNHETGDAFT